MKTIAILLMMITLASCGNNRYRARCADGSLITVEDGYDVRPELGDTVYVRQIDSYGWNIINEPIGADTSYLNSWGSKSDSTYECWVVQKRAVKLVREL
jgi:hypothetical protein